jgi:hypothetical protein
MLILSFSWMADSSLRGKSPTADEIAHLTRGVSYWKTSDYRLQPENGILPERWAALPVYLGGYAFPSAEESAWKQSKTWNLGHQFFYRQGNDLDRMLRAARRMVLLMGAALGLVVYEWSRRLFGAAGGIISLLLYTFSPNILAHSCLVTSDITFAFFLTVTLGSLWWMFHRLHLVSLLASSLLVGLLFLAKASAILLLPMLLILVGIRLLSQKPIFVRIGKTKCVESRGGRLAVLASSLAINFVVTVGLI